MTEELTTIKNEITIFGETNYRNQRKSFGIKREDRVRHMYVIGKTGMGKTTLLENMIISDIIHGEGCCYVDPHGDTAEKILNYIPANRINDVVYLNPADTEYPIAFNVLEAVDEKDKSLIASGLISVFKKLWADSWGPRLEYILRNAILALLDYPGSTLLGIMRILVDKEYREKVIDKIKDPVVKSFWVNEYAKWNERVLQEVISPIQNKVGQFLSNFLIRNIVGQVKSTIDLRQIMDDKKILILNLSKGRIGEDTMQLLGSMIVTKLYLAAMSRVDIPEKDRSDFYLYVDEFQNFATESFANILSEARKYRLNLVVAHQYIEQLPEEVSAAIFGNVGTLICFRVGAVDAEILVKEFTPFFEEEDLVNLPAFSVYLKLMIDGISSDPFSAATLPPLFEDFFTGSTEKVIKVSRERYAHPRAVVEDKINRWSGMDLSEKMMESISGEQSERKKFQPSSGPREKSRPPGERREGERKERREEPRMARPAPAGREEQKQYDIICALCGKNSKINFKPDGQRPVYCDDCMPKIREERRKKKEDRTVKLEEVKEVKEVPPISLSAALGKEPVTFGQGKRTVQSSKSDWQEEKQVAADESRNEPAISANVAPKVSEDNRQLTHEEKQILEWYEEAKQKFYREQEEKAKQAANQQPGSANSDNNQIKPGQVVKF